MEDASWFKDGINDEEAPLIPALHTQARRGEYFNDLLAKHTADSITFKTPKGVEVTVVSYTFSGRSGLSFLRGMEKAVVAMEELTTVPFPTEDLIYVFALPADDEFSGWTHCRIR